MDPLAEAWVLSCHPDGPSVSLLVTAGMGCLAMDGKTMPLSAGDSVFLPAGSGNFRVEGDCTVLLTRV